MAALTKGRLFFDSADLAGSDNVAANLVADGTALTSTGTSLDVRNTTAEGILTTIDADTGSIATDASTIATNTGTTATNTGTIASDTTSIDSTLTALSKTEDDAHSSGSQGLQVFGVRNDTLASLVDTDGDLAMLQVDASGALYTTTSISNLSLDSEYAEDSPHSTGETGQFVLGVANHSEGALHSADGDYAALQLDSSGRLRVTANVTVDPSDAEYLQDAGFTGGDVGIHTLQRREDALSTTTSADDDYDSIKGDVYGRVYVTEAPNVSVTSAAETIAAANTAQDVATSTLTGRTRMIIQNGSTDEIYIGGTGVTTSTGIEIAKKATMTLEIGENVDLQVVSGTISAAYNVMQMS